MQEPTNTPDNKSSSAGLAVLQWLTYAFWGWLILGIIWLIWIILTNAISDTAMEEIVPYSMAASIVMLPLAFVVDLFYRKYEPAKKQGVNSVLMVVHAVLFALLGIGVLIVAVFLGLNLLIGSGSSDTESQVIALLALAAATILYVAAFLRTLNPFKTQKVARIYGYSMLAVTVVLLALAAVGPMLTSISLRDDRRIESNLGTVSRAVDLYIRDNKQLPDNLASVEYSSPEAQALVDDGLVEYKKDQAVLDSRGLAMTQYRYQLCVDFEKASGQTSYNYGDEDEYQTYPSVYGHESGDVCYKLYTEVVNSEPVSTLTPGVTLDLKN